MKFLHIRYPNSDSWFNSLSKFMPDYYGINPSNRLLGDIVWLNPDTIFIQNAINYSSRIVNQIKKFLPEVQIIGHHNTLLNKRIINNLKAFDLVFVGMKSTQNTLLSAGINAQIMLHAYDHTIKLNDNPKSNRILVTGGMSRRFHKTRRRMVRQMRKNNIDINILPIMPYQETLQAIKDHKYVFNCHADIATEATNMRMFEVCGVGSLLITDHFNTTPFEPNEALTYMKESNVWIGKNNLSDTINWIIRNPDIAEEIAKKGHEKVLQFHTVEHRAKVFNQLLYEGIKTN